MDSIENQSPSSSNSNQQQDPASKEEEIKFWVMVGPVDEGLSRTLIAQVFRHLGFETTDVRLCIGKNGVLANYCFVRFRTTAITSQVIQVLDGTPWPVSGTRINFILKPAIKSVPVGLRNGHLLFISNLCYSHTTDHLMDEFVAYSNSVVNAEFISDEFGFHTGNAIVKFDERDDAIKCIYHLANLPCACGCGRLMKVSAHRFGNADSHPINHVDRGIPYFRHLTSLD